jgi:pyrroloquinoline-quinone synthase
MEHCRTPDEQARAVAALSFKNDVLWSMMDAIDRAYPGITRQGDG